MTIASPTTGALGVATVQKLLESKLAAKLSVELSALDTRARFSRYGANSMMMTTVLAELSRELGRPLSVTLAWQYPNIVELASAIALDQAPNTIQVGASARRPTNTADDPVAVVGLACRFPGAASPDAFFDSLMRGVDAVNELDHERFAVDQLYDRNPEAVGHACTRWAGLLDSVATFDAPFFGISRREATHMDPQQRLMMELAWEALEDAGVPPRELRGSPTSVFVGAMWSDYAALRRGALRAIAQHTAVGEDLSIIPARISYLLGLQGPSLSVNTACSSSLVALHLACQSLVSGESSMALVGGVNLILAPDSLVTMSKFGAMAPDGRSKAFDAGANGYVRGEGGGLVVLKRLSRARADGDRVYAVILGSALNNDGFSNGLTAPNPRAQEAVLRDAYARAGVSPTQVEYIETHGTGTLLGDPIEANAIGAALGTRRAGEPPLWLGAVKTNIGHLEAAAGIAGFIKACLAVERGMIPPNLHFKSPNPHVAFEQLGLAVPTTPVAWPGRRGRRVAGVSSFGFGGTNAHVVLASQGFDVPQIIPLQAKDLSELQVAARDVAAQLEQGASGAEMLRAFTEARGSNAVRAAVVGRSRSEALERLRALASPGSKVDAPKVQSGLPMSTPRTLFVFSPNGSQFRGMGGTLLQDPVFSRAFDACDAACRKWLDWSLREELLFGTDEGRLDRIDVGQPLLFAVQYALAVRLAAWGIEPDAVLGHSVGEVAAACVAGSLDVEDGARIVVHRSRLMQLADGKGAMALVDLPAADVERELAVYAGAIQVSGYNGARSTVVSGDTCAIQTLLNDLTERGIDVHQVKRTNIAAHSAHMDDFLEPLREELSALAPRPARIAIYSTVTSELQEGHLQDASYWVRNLREPVRFDPTLRRALSEGYSLIVEISPHPLLAHGICATLADRGDTATVVAAQHRDHEPSVGLLEAVGVMHRAGVALDWERIFGLRSDPPSPIPDLLALSAHTPKALAELARRTADAIEASRDSIAALCRSSRECRSHHAHRLAVVAGTRQAFAEKLRSLASGVDRLGARPVSGEAGKIAFVFSGQGPQWWGMGRELVAAEPVFRGVISACDRILRRCAGWSLLEALGDDESSSRVHDVEVTQPALFALQAALFTLLGSWGVRPVAVVGHSLGEVSAAYAAGALSLTDALQLTVARALAMRSAFGNGRMLAVEAAEAAIDLSRFGTRITRAAVNGPRSIAFAGEPESLLELQVELASRGIDAKFLRGQLAFHCPQMQPAAAELARALTRLQARNSRIDLISTVHGRRVNGSELGAAYWSEQVVEPVRFSKAIDVLIESGHTTFIEVSPHPALSSAVMQCLEERGCEGHTVPTLRRGKAEVTSLLEVVAELYRIGHDSTLPARAVTEPRAVLPSYPWQRRRYWLEVTNEALGVARSSDASAVTDATDPRTVDEPIEEGVSLGEQLRSAGDPQLLLERHITQHVAALLMLATNETVDVQQGFFELGLDSLLVTRLRLELQRDLARTLPISVVFDYPTVRKLSTHLANQSLTSADPQSERRAARGDGALSWSGDDVELALLSELSQLEAVSP